MSVSICIATYGDDLWRTLALERAWPSTREQGASEVLLEHQPHGTIATARNAAAERATGDWLIFLDADDELDKGYVMAMENAVDAELFSVRKGYTAKLFTPMVAYCERGRRQAPKFWPVCPFEDGNWMVVGTMIHHRVFHELGGFRNYGDPPGSNAYEDWGLWALAQREGATVVKVPDAVYVAHVESSSRHRGSDHKTRLRWHYEIGRDLFPDRYPEDWVERWGRPARRRSSARERRRA